MACIYPGRRPRGQHWSKAQWQANHV